MDSKEKVAVVAKGATSGSSNSDKASSASSQPVIRRLKYEMCKNWREKGNCKYNDKCLFAHGVDELTKRSSANGPEPAKPLVPTVTIEDKKENASAEKTSMKILETHNKEGSPTDSEIQTPAFSCQEVSTKVSTGANKEAAAEQTFSKLSAIVQTTKTGGMQSDNATSADSSRPGKSMIEGDLNFLLDRDL